MRPNNRAADQVRPIKITRNYTAYAEGSVLVEFGNTKVLCNATVEENVPRWLKGQGKGWVTAEYGMLPRATHTRTRREAASGSAPPDCACRRARCTQSGLSCRARNGKRLGACAQCLSARARELAGAPARPAH